MSGWGWFALVAVVVIVLAFLLYLSMTAGRLDRLHRRVEIAQANLESALHRRRDVADHATTLGLLDPASAMLIADAAARVDENSGAGAVANYVAESDLTKVLAAVFDDPAEVDVVVHEPGGDVFIRLADACRKVQIGRRFHNDAVSATRSMRSRPLVRTFRLQGHAQMPLMVEMDDSPPRGFAGR